MSTLNLHHLRLFRAVARDGTLTGAARALNISQSAVSTQIKSLEAALGHDLFERRGRNLVLSEAGRIALDHADEVFRAAYAHQVPWFVGWQERAGAFDRPVHLLGRLADT